MPCHLPDSPKTALTMSMTSQDTLDDEHDIDGWSRQLRRARVCSANVAREGSQSMHLEVGGDHVGGGRAGAVQAGLEGGALRALRRRRHQRQPVRRLVVRLGERGVALGGGSQPASFQDMSQQGTTLESRQRLSASPVALENH